MRIRARLGMVALALAVLGGLAVGFLPRPVPVEVAEVASGPMEVVVEEEGKTRVRDRYVISAPVAGHVRRITLRAGDALKVGQAVAVIEPASAAALDPRSRAQAAAAARAAEASLAAAREKARAAVAQAELARHELERAESLRQSKFISAQALDKARSDADRTRAAKSAAEHDVTAARFEVERTLAAVADVAKWQGGRQTDALTIRTPVDARVLKVAHESEGAVPAGAPLIEVGDPESLEVEVEVLSTQAVKIAPGARVLFDRWGGETTLQGVVRVIEPTGYTKVSALGVEEQRVRVIVDFISPREQRPRVGDGYRVEARFVVWRGEDVMQIPASALFRHDSGWAAFVAEGGRARLRAVEIGQRAGLRVQVRSGLKAGEAVIAHPDDKIADGKRIRLR